MQTEQPHTRACARAHASLLYVYIYVCLGLSFNRDEAAGGCGSKANDVTRAPDNDVTLSAAAAAENGA